MDSKEKKLKGEKAPKKNKIKKEKRFFVFINRFFNLILLIVVLLVLSLGYLLVIKDQYQKLVMTRDVELHSLTSDIDYLEDNKGPFVEYVKKMVRLSAEEEILLSLALPSKFDVASIIVQIDSLADNYNFQTVRLNINESKSNFNTDGSWTGQGKLNEIEIDIELAGENYDDWRHFLSALESSIMIFDTVAINFSSAGSVYKLNLVAYYYPEEQ